MSGFAAVFRFDGAPAGTAALAAMTQAIAYRGPDGISQWAEGRAAISHLMLHTTAESLEETQPLVNEAAGLVLVMDGWLANYEELRNDLLARGAVLRTRSDAELVLRAYETWGDDCPKHIDGEYAFVVWDARRREVFCAKDHAGMRPLHYHWDGKRLLVASDLAGVLAADDFEPRPNKGMIAEHLANRWFSRDETLWEGVLRLPPSHALRIGPGGPRLQRYWMPPLAERIRYPRDEDYQVHYRELLADCVRRASRSHLPLGCEVSGGLDSSAVFAVASRLSAQGKLLAPALRGYTYNFGPDADPAVDELEYGRAVASHCGVEVHEVTPFMPELDWFLRRGGSDQDIPPYPNAAMATNTGLALLRDGCRVALNGEGGDEFLTGNALYYADQILERDWRGFSISFQEDVAAFGLGQTAGRILRWGIGPALPVRLRAMVRGLRRTDLRDEFGLDFCWMSPDLQAGLPERRNLLDQPILDSIRSPARRGLFMALNDGFLTYARDYMSRNAAHVGYDLRSPMYSRRFMEFAFAIPSRMRMRGGIRKHLHATAMTGLLPDKVLQRRTDVRFNLPFERLLDSGKAPMLEELLQRGIDVINRAGLDRLWDCFEREPLGSRPIYELWAVVGCLNLFGRTADESPALCKEFSDGDFSKRA